MLIKTAKETQRATLFMDSSRQPSGLKFRRPSLFDYGLKKRCRPERPQTPLRLNALTIVTVFTGACFAATMAWIFVS
jgi:hypothetical protein